MTDRATNDVTKSDGRREKMRVRVNLVLAAPIAFIPVLFAYILIWESVALGKSANGEEIDVAGRIITGMVATPIVLVCLQYVLFYYIEIDGVQFRQVRFFGIGSSEFPIDRAQVRLRRENGWHPMWWAGTKLVISEGDRNVTLLLERTAGPIFEHWWPRNRLVPLLEEMAERGARVEDPVWAYLGVKPPLTHAGQANQA